MNGEIRVMLVTEKHWTGIKKGKTYKAKRCEDDSRFLIIENDYGEKYAFPASDFEIID